MSIMIIRKVKNKLHTIHRGILSAPHEPLDRKSLQLNIVQVENTMRTLPMHNATMWVIYVLSYAESSRRALFAEAVSKRVHLAEVADCESRGHWFEPRSGTYFSLTG